MGQFAPYPVDDRIDLAIPWGAFTVNIFNYTPDGYRPGHVNPTELYDVQRAWLARRRRQLLYMYLREMLACLD